MIYHDLPIKMAIFHSYVSLPEGSSYHDVPISYPQAGLGLGVV